jgi:hypothetical protein
MSLFQNSVSFDRLMQFLRLKPYETAFLKVAVPKLEVLEQPHIPISAYSHTFAYIRGQKN